MEWIHVAPIYFVVFVSGWFMGIILCGKHSREMEKMYWDSDLDLIKAESKIASLKNIIAHHEIVQKNHREIMVRDETELQLLRKKMQQPLNPKEFGLDDLVNIEPLKKELQKIKRYIWSDIALNIPVSCLSCGEPQNIEVIADDWLEYQRGDDIEKAMPYLDKETIDLIEGGICGKCRRGEN